MKNKERQAGAELGQAQDKLKVIVEFKLRLRVRMKLITTSPGGCWILRK